MPTAAIIAPKKLIEVALPLDEINKASAKEKSIRHGHSASIHLWWSRKPLALARAVLFAQLVNDPSWKYSDEELKKPQIRSAITRKRNELFSLITELVQWENTTNANVLSRAQAAIRDSWRETCEANKNHSDPDVRRLFDPTKLPPVHDPFAGGGSIPIEAQRLGLDAYAGDLNPVAVLINRAMIEIPPRFAGYRPVGPVPSGEKQTKAKAAEDLSGAKGLAEDVRRYGVWMQNEAWRKIGHSYPDVTVTAEVVKKRPDLKPYQGRKLKVIAWLWARTVASPNPLARGAHVPLMSSLCLSSGKSNEVWVRPTVDRSQNSVILEPVHGRPDNIPDSTVSRNGGTCLLTGALIPLTYIRSEAQARRLGLQLIAIVADTAGGGRIYLPPYPDHQAIGREPPSKIASMPDTDMPDKAIGFRIQEYGMRKHRDLFSARQQLTLSTFAELVGDAHKRVVVDAKAAGLADQDATAYADAVATYLGLGTSKLADYNSLLSSWSSSRDQARNTFGMQALPMIWSSAEVNPFADAAGNLLVSLGGITKALERLPAKGVGVARQAAAQTASGPAAAIISTDPPYYDNIGYAELSDFFYFWLRQSLGRIHPDLFATILTPKGDELVAEPFRHRGKDAAEKFFLDGMREVLTLCCARTCAAAPITLYYAFKQSDTSDDGTSSTGWETFLSAILESGLVITGTWPTRSERGGRMRDVASNALASSIVLVCRPRAEGVASPSRREFLRELEQAMPLALTEMTADPTASIAPVDLQQAAIGPGMAIFSKYKTVLEADGSAMSVHAALIHINKAIDDHFAHGEGVLDADTRFCIDWFQQRGFEPGPFGEADVLARAKGTAVDGVVEAGVLSATKGKVRLLRVKEYPKKWDPTTDQRVPIWEACHQMCRALGESERDAGELLARMPDKQDAVRQLAYRLYTICERQKWAEEARAYNELITSWPAIVEESHKIGHAGTQLELV